MRERRDAELATVPEHLRRWCDEQGRTPQRHEQAGVFLGVAAHDLDSGYPRV